MKKIDYLTDADLDRQSCVDNSIYYLIQDLAKDNNIDWDVEDIGEVRDAIENIIVNKLKLMTDHEFYPYIVLEEEELPQSKLDELLSQANDNQEPEPEEIIVTDEQLVVALKDAIDDMDADELAMFAGDMLGGKCWFNHDETYTFETTECYWGAFDNLKGKKDEKE